MFTVSGAELQGSGLAIRNQRVRQTLLPATHPRPVRIEALVSPPRPQSPGLSLDATQHQPPAFSLISEEGFSKAHPLPGSV